MNYRQAKKAYKKEYGVSPDQTIRALKEVISPENLQSMTDQIVNALQLIVEEAIEVLKMMPEALRKMMERAEEIQKEQQSRLSTESQEN